MRMIAAAFAGAAIFLAGCDGNGASEEESRTEETAGDTEEDDADSDEGDSGEETEQD